MSLFDITFAVAHNWMFYFIKIDVARWHLTEELLCVIQIESTYGVL